MFTDAEIVELELVTGAFIVLGRLHRAFGIAPMTAAAHAALAGHDTGERPGTTATAPGPADPA